MIRPIHVWRAALDLSSGGVDALREYLSDEERARVKRFYFPRDARRWTVARGTLRLLLARYTGVRPQDLRFRLNQWGKPALDWAGADLRFNLSHCGGVALYAIARSADVGIDVEEIREGRADGAIVEHFFSPREVRDWTRLASGDRLRAFFRCWTRKEAYIKAVGQGLGIPLSSFDVSLQPGEPPALIDARHPSGRRRWTFSDIDAGPGYAAALAIEGPPRAVRCRQWPAAAVWGGANS